MQSFNYHGMIMIISGTDSYTLTFILT